MIDFSVTALLSTIDIFLNILSNISSYCDYLSKQKQLLGMIVHVSYMITKGEDVGGIS